MLLRPRRVLVASKPMPRRQQQRNHLSLRVVDLLGSCSGRRTDEANEYQRNTYDQTIQHQSKLADWVPTPEQIQSIEEARSLMGFRPMGQQTAQMTFGQCHRCPCLFPDWLEDVEVRRGSGFLPWNGCTAMGTYRAPLCCLSMQIPHGSSACLRLLR